ncbi:hypothetical protein BRADI_1g43396v3 [Brachypodium distachyon]|uniref:Uncharacterized protein n=1 Tax=Brachypodium distachyon TaxID=15368 RepID=A0A0Q3L5T1_BRADI|nr:hypothetical protein BRADI_1g43396v3 [Brachypodium distachyon]
MAAWPPPTCSLPNSYLTRSLTSTLLSHPPRLPPSFHGVRRLDLGVPLHKLDPTLTDPPPARPRAAGLDPTTPDLPPASIRRIHRAEPPRRRIRNALARVLSDPPPPSRGATGNAAP